MARMLSTTFDSINRNFGSVDETKEGVVNRKEDQAVILAKSEGRIPKRF